jgi:integrase
MKMLKYKKFVGLHVICKKCGKILEINQDPYNDCNHPIERQRYKAVIRLNGGRRTRDLKSLDYTEAVKELIDFKDELKNPYFLSIEDVSDHNNYCFNDFVMMFSDWLENVDVPRHEQKQRSTKHIKETVGYIQKMGRFIQSKGYDISTLKMSSVNKHLLGDYYGHLESVTKAHSTFNHHIRALKHFYKFLINEKGLDISDIPSKMKLKYESPNPISISVEDFKKILSVITDNNSVQILSNGVRKNRYRSYTKLGIELCAYSGMRLEEVTILKYSDIHYDTEGNPEYILGTDLKFERAHNWDNTKEPKRVFIPMSIDLLNLLVRLEYKSNIGIDKYLIADDEKIERRTLAKQLSHSFSYYRDVAGVDKTISIKHLRKTFLTELHIQTGFTESMGYQKTNKVIIDNYIDKRAVVKAANKKGLSLYGNDEK